MIELGVGVCIRPLSGEEVSGDACASFRWERGILATIADGLGHGPKAALAAQTFLESVATTREAPIEQIFARAHQALLHTRGAVAGLARIDETSGKLEVAVIGNITAYVFRGGGARTVHVLTMPGVLGSAYRTVRAQAIDLAADDVVVMHSDGIRARADLGAIRSMTPETAAEHVVRSAARATDDAACIVVRVRAGASRPHEAPQVEAGTSEKTVPIRTATDPVCAAAETRAFAQRIGLSPRAQWEASIAVSELATNALKFGDRGTLTLRHVHAPREALVMEVADNGNGIEDIGNALVDGYSEGAPLTPDTRRFGRGLGVGLGTVHRMSDEVTIQNEPGGGTRVVAWKYRR